MKKIQVKPDKANYSLSPAPASPSFGTSPSSLFTYYENSHPETLVCIICQCPLVDPISPCEEGHVFCRFCLSSWVGNPKNAGRCPGPGCKEVLTAEEVVSAKVVKPVEKMVEALKVTCPNKGKGCTWVDERNSLKRHLDETCRFFPCPHVGCKELFTSSNLPSHQCPFEPVDCPQLCGVKPLPRKLVGAHVEEECNVTLAKRAEEARVAEDARLEKEKTENERRLAAAKVANESAVQRLMDRPPGGSPWMSAGLPSRRP